MYIKQFNHNASSLQNNDLDFNKQILTSWKVDSHSDINKKVAKRECGKIMAQVLHNAVKVVRNATVPFDTVPV